MLGCTKSSAIFSQFQCHRRVYILQVDILQYIASSIRTEQSAPLQIFLTFCWCFSPFIGNLCLFPENHTHALAFQKKDPCMGYMIQKSCTVFLFRIMISFFLCVFFSRFFLGISYILYISNVFTTRI